MTTEQLALILFNWTRKSQGLDPISGWDTANIGEETQKKYLNEAKYIISKMTQETKHASVQTNGSVVIAQSEISRLMTEAEFRINEQLAVHFDLMPDTALMNPPAISAVIRSRSRPK